MPRLLAAADTERKQYLSLRPHLVFILSFIHTPENGCGDYPLNTLYYTSFTRPNNLSYLLSNFVFLSLKTELRASPLHSWPLPSKGLELLATRSNLPVMSEKQNMHFKKYAKGKMLRKSPRHEVNIWVYIVLVYRLIFRLVFWSVLLCAPGWPSSQRSSCLCLWGTEIKSDVYVLKKKIKQVHSLHRHTRFPTLHHVCWTSKLTEAWTINICSE